MKFIRKTIMLQGVVSSLLLLSCVPNQLFGFSIIPSPTSTSTPSHTPTATATLTPTLTSTPLPTATITPLPCTLEVFSSTDLSELEMIFNRPVGQQHLLIEDQGETVSKLIKIKGTVYLMKSFEVPKEGRYWVSVDVKREGFSDFRVAVYDHSPNQLRTEITIRSATLSETNYVTVSRFFKAGKLEDLYILLGGRPVEAATTVLMKNLRICLAD